MVVGATSVAAVLVLALILSAVAGAAFGLIADYVRYVRAQRSFSLPRLGPARARHAGRGLRRDARRAGRPPLRGRLCADAHPRAEEPALGDPGAAELMRESGMPEADRQRFVANIGRETQRIQELVDRMMELAALEQQRPPAQRSSRSRCGRCWRNWRPAPKRAVPRAACASSSSPRATPPGSRARPSCCAAPWATLANALEFSPDGGTIHLALAAGPRSVSLSVRDHGPGIPDYADERVFEKFYSLARPATGKKSTGLGLAFVKGRSPSCTMAA